MIWFHKAVQELLVDADRVHPNPRNANNGDVDAIVESLHINGCYRPIYAASDGEIVAGHHLYQGLLQEGCTQVPVMFIDGDAAQARRILLGDNQIASLARMDHGLLLDLLEDVMREDESLLGTGFIDDDVVHLKAEQDPKPPEDHEAFISQTEITCPECGHSWTMRREQVV